MFSVSFSGKNGVFFSQETYPCLPGRGAFFPFFSRLSEGVDDGWHGWHGGGNTVKTNGNLSDRTEPKKTKVSETFMFLVLWKKGFEF